MKKVFLPILLILCTVLLLSANIFAGSESGERIAVLAKNTGTIDMTNASVKEDVFSQADQVTAITGSNGGTATISAAWDENAIYFYIEVNDPNLTHFIQRYASAQDKTDKQAQNDYQKKLNTKVGSADLHATTDDPMNPGHKLSERYETERSNGAGVYPWEVPCVEIMIDPANNGTAVYQGRVVCDGYKMSYVPVLDSQLSYNMYSTDRYTAVTNLEFNGADKATGEYQVKMMFTKENLGMTGFESWDMISVHPFVRFATNNGGISGGTDGYAQFDIDNGVRDDWAASRYSYYRLWDAADTEHTGANASEVASKYTDTKITTSSSSTMGGIVISSSTSSSTSSSSTSSSTTPSGGATTAPSNTTTPSTTTTNQGGGEDKGGCGSVIGGAVAVVAAAMIAAPVIVLRKKDEE